MPASNSEARKRHERGDRLTLPATAHHPDCDGWRFAHVRRTVIDRHPVEVLYRVECVDCGPLHTGSAGDEYTAGMLAERSAGCEAATVRCAGECESWWTE